ncbi:TetR/AcrR family transcriptional regulator [Gordonia zhaorongruii]|uniref:TetR/AcrR family transcriptional regulator n=1 Tax=Gordonia zhaorongruii TaxID=2597659 RepID=UPI001046E342|nr:TetR family transcriptional regulator [Gordonia zhaorongruii]
MTGRQAHSNRRQAIATAGVRIIARDGVRALTHRAVDAEADLPQGSTSYHARTRAALVELVVETLAQRSTTDTEQLTPALDADINEPLQIAELTGWLSRLIETLAERRDDMRARYALILELDDQSPLHGMLTTHSELHELGRKVIRTALHRASLPDSDKHVEELVALADALVFYRTAIDRHLPLEPPISAYLHGVTATR